MAKFPKTIHVTLENRGTPDWYFSVAEGDLSNIDETTTVGVYQLVEVGEVVVTRTVEKKYNRGAAPT